MNSVDSKREAHEIELKLALPTSDPSGLLRRLSRTAVLARRRPTQTRLHNVYYDTPDQLLRRQRTSLRIRRVGEGAQAQWLQTLKIGNQGLSALSQRGEWEVPVRGEAPDPALLAATPWAAFDTDGSVFGALAPAFVTAFDRTSWLVRRRDHSVIEVALDIGQITAGGKEGRICELELELKAGPPAALFELAQQLAAAVVVMPLATSKSERGYSLAEGTLEAPLRARSPVLTPQLSLPAAAQRLLREMFCQVTTNLDTMRRSSDPEVLHQARVGWRRFRSAWRLLAASLPDDTPPSWEPLRPLMTLVGEQRDLDVALTETMPALGQAFVAGDQRRTQDWQALELAIGNACTLQRSAVRNALEDPVVGATLLRTTQWIESLTDGATGALAQTVPTVALRDWARRRIDRLDNRLRAAIRQGDSPEDQHRVRIMAKRLRYGIEALRSLLPKKSTQRLYREATELQTRIGAARDVLQASAIAARLQADRGLVEFLRGVAVGRTV